MRAVGLVIAFWWVATGVIIALQRNASTRIAGIVLATVLALIGSLEMRAVRDDDSPAGVRRAFLGGAMLWAWVSAAFYGGFLTGIHPSGPVASAPSWGAVMPAIAATLVNDAATIVLLLGGAFMAQGTRNRTGLWALLLFWGVQQVAKLNVFLGVANPAANFLPEHLGYLRQFFGPEVNSPFLGASLTLVTVATLVVARRARTAPTPGAREAAALYATILGLAVLELAVLGVRLERTPWDSFLRARGG